MKLQTVNVLEVEGNTPTNIHSFTDDPEGNEQAEKRFIKLVKKHGGTDEDMASCLEDGIYEKGNYQFSIIHSS
jgi:hypothetical protein